MKISTSLVACVRQLTKAAHLTTIAVFSFVILGRSESCDPNSTAPLVAFSIRQDVSKAREDYEAPPVTCTFSVDQMSYMHFVAQENSSTFFVDAQNEVQFGCSEKLKDGRYKQIVPTMKLLSAAFAGTSLKVENCKYVISAIPDHVAKTTNAESARNLNLQDNEQRLIQEALQDAQGDTSAAARRLGISEAALKRRLKEHPVTASQRPSAKTAAAESQNCVVYNLRFRYTKNAQGNSGESRGNLTRVWCDFNDTTLGLNERENYYRKQQAGILLNNVDSIESPAITCRRSSDIDSPPVEITWAILEDIYGYDAIKENKIPPECRLGATAH